MFAVKLTVDFKDWLGRLRDSKAKLAIIKRLQRLELGNHGDAKALGEGLSEMRIDVGPGYRVYYVRRGEILFVVLWGGDKSSQDRDIAKARDIVTMLEDEE